MVVYLLFFFLYVWTYTTNQSLFDSSLIEGINVATSVGEMFAIADSKVVGAGEIFLGTHIDVVVLLVVEYGIDSSDGWDAYRTRR